MIIDAGAGAVQSSPPPIIQQRHNNARAALAVCSAATALVRVSVCEPEPDLAPPRVGRGIRGPPAACLPLQAGAAPALGLVLGCARRVVSTASSQNQGSSGSSGASVAMAIPMGSSKHTPIPIKKTTRRRPRRHSRAPCRRGAPFAWYGRQGESQLRGAQAKIRRVRCAGKDARGEDGPAGAMSGPTTTAAAGVLRPAYRAAAALAAADHFGPAAGGAQSPACAPAESLRHIPSSARARRRPSHTPPPPPRPASSPTSRPMPARPKMRTRSNTNPTPGQSSTSTSASASLQDITAAQLAYKEPAALFYTVNAKYRISWECAELLTEPAAARLCLRLCSAPPRGLRARRRLSSTRRRQPRSTSRRPARSGAGSV